MVSSGGAAGGVPLPTVDPAVSARYRWTECGRIEPTVSRPRHALYASDETILVTDELGGIRLYTADAASSQVLLKPSPTANRSFDAGLALSSNGERLLRWYGADVDVYEAGDGGVIGANSGPLVPLAHIDRAGSECGAEGGVSFSADGQRIVGKGASSVCIWDASSGDSITTIHLPAVPADGWLWVVPGIATDTELAPVRVLHDRTLRTYTAEGTPAESFDLGSWLQGT